MERTSGKVFKKIVELKIAKQKVRFSTGLREVTGHCGGVGPF
jgi:hypothetical protein